MGEAVTYRVIVRHTKTNYQWSEVGSLTQLPDRFAVEGDILDTVAEAISCHGCTNVRLVKEIPIDEVVVKIKAYLEGVNTFGDNCGE